MNIEPRLSTLQKAASRAALPQLAQRVEWLGLALSVPAGWENRSTQPVCRGGQLALRRLGAASGW